MNTPFSFSLFQARVKSISSLETKEIINSDEVSNFQLLDVRQPGEYAKGHIPGALLIPLADLGERYTELDSDKATIVYCRSGVRSKTACQLLNRLGVDDVLNMQGGIISYNGEQIEGHADAGLELFMDADFTSAYELVFTMEAGLKNFYLTLADEATTDGERDLLLKMSRFEDAHMTRLAKKFGEADFDTESTITEGGLDIEQMISYFGEQLGSREQILQLAMKLEAQAFDLYSRLAREHQGEEMEAFYQSMAADEHKHLLQVSKELDNLL